MSVQEQSAFLDGIKPNQEILQQDVASLKQIVDDMQYVSYDGTLIWKIISFHEKMSKFDLQNFKIIIYIRIDDLVSFRTCFIQLFIF